MDEAEKPQESETPSPPASGSVGPMGAMGEFSDPAVAPVARAESVAPVGPMGEIRLEESESSAPAMRIAALESAPEVETPAKAEPETLGRVEPETFPAADLPAIDAEIPIAPAPMEIQSAVETPNVPLDY